MLSLIGSVVYGVQHGLGEGAAAGTPGGCIFDPSPTVSEHPVCSEVLLAGTPVGWLVAQPAVLQAP